jgi:hypothetical protein
MKFPPKELDALFTPRSFTAGVKAQEAQSGYDLPPELLAEMIGGGSGRRRSLADFSSWTVLRVIGDPFVEESSLNHKECTTPQVHRKNVRCLLFSLPPGLGKRPK